MEPSSVVFPLPKPISEKVFARLTVWSPAEPLHKLPETIDTYVEPYNLLKNGIEEIKETDVERIMNKAISEGGQVLITNTGAADLSALQDNSNGKDSKKSSLNGPES